MIDFLSLPHLQISDKFTYASERGDRWITFFYKLDMRSPSPVEITMNLALTSDGVYKPLKSFVKIFIFFEFQRIFWRKYVHVLLKWMSHIRKWGRVKKSIKKKFFFLFFVYSSVSRQDVLIHKMIQNTTMKSSSHLKKKRFLKSINHHNKNNVKYDALKHFHRIHEVESLKIFCDQVFQATSVLHGKNMLFLKLIKFVFG